MGFPISRCPTSYVMGSLYNLINDDPLDRTVPINLDEMLLVCRYDCWIKPKFLLGYLEKPKNRGYKLKPIVVNIELFRCNPPESVEGLDPCERSIDSEA